MSYKMLLNRKKFLNETEFGRAMEKLVREWDGLLETKETPETIRKEAHCMSQWEVYQLAMKQFYGLDCHFTRTNEYFGIWIEDDATFLLKVDRGTRKLTTDEPSERRDYEELIQGKVKARTALEKMVGQLTKVDAGLVLAMIGLDHPASETVFRHLAAEKIEKVRGSAYLSMLVKQHM